MKISVIGAGNVGSLTAMRLAHENLGEIFLIDIVKGLGHGKALDLEDAQGLLGINYYLKGSDDIKDLRDSDIIVVTAGLARKPGMTREELLGKNAQILKDLSLNIKNLAPSAIIIIVTNPLDLMTYLALKITGFNSKKLFGMGVTLDASRFANLIAQELKVKPNDIEAVVVASHGEGMLPLSRFTKVKGKSLDSIMDQAKIDSLVKRTVARGAEIVSNLGSGSAFFAPSAAVAQIVKAIVKDERRILGVSAYLSGEYGVNGVCLGVPCSLGKNGIEKVIELDLNPAEKDLFIKSAESVKGLLKSIELYL
ncbi:malate dehydrogenase [bacterium]|nr:MAG: malate dehydrogenase [bacterium]